MSVAPALIATLIARDVRRGYAGGGDRAAARTMLRQDSLQHRHPVHVQAIARLVQQP
jgi:hypothetical protein